MSRYKAYSEYRNSGVAWLGKTPSTWTLAPLKWFIERNDGGVWGDDPDGENDTLVLRSTEQTVDGFWKMEDPAPRKLSTSDKEFALLRAGDLVVTKSSGSSLHIGKTTIVTDEIERLQCCYSNFMQRIRTSRLLLPKLAWYVMNNELSRAQFDFLSNSTTGLANLNGTMVGQIVLAIPSEVEQQAIINFLDHETAKIDALIEKQQRLIELLKEKRQAVISHAVTKGLNPNAPLKDSGVEWLGEVPAHWVSTRLKYLKGLEPNSFVDGPFGSNLKSEHFVDDGVVYVIESGFATTAQLDTAQLKKITLQHYETIKRSTTKGGDIIIAKIGARYGSSSILPELDSKAVVSGNSLKLTVNESLLTNDFANELLRVLKANDAMDDGVNITAQPALSLGGLNNLPFLRIPLSEQYEIVKFIKEQNEIFDGLIEKAALFINLSIERRTALISAAVTGKIDVRDWQAAA